MGSSQHALVSSRRCVESDPKVCRERPKGKEKSASPSRLRPGADIWKASDGSSWQCLAVAADPVSRLHLAR